MNVLQEIKLRATQYLPDIIQLQQILYKRFNYITDDEELTLEDISNGNSKAWGLTLQALILL